MYRLLIKVWLGRSCSSFVKHCLYLTLTFALAFFLVLLVVTPNWSQIVFVDNLPYQAELWTSDGHQASFAVVDGQVASEQERGGVNEITYGDELAIFLPLGNVVYEETPFCNQELIMGKSADELRQGEAIVNENALMSLRAEVGDVIHIISSDGADVTYTVAGVLRSSYSYGEVKPGGRALALVDSEGPASQLQKNFENRRFVHYFQNDDRPNGVLTKNQLLQDAAHMADGGLTLSVFAAFGAVLIAAIVFREFSALFKGTRVDRALLEACGMYWTRPFVTYARLEIAAIIVSSLLAVLIDKGLFEYVFSLYRVPFGLVGCCVMASLIVGLLVLALSSAIIRKRESEVKFYSLINGDDYGSSNRI